MFIVGLTIIIKQEDTPEDKRLSSGDSVIMENMVKIDNYANGIKYIKNYAFSFWEQIDVIQDEDDYPQGLCITDEFVFISSYSDIRGKLGKIRVFDKNSGEHLLSLGLDASSHMGGIAFDGESLWICNSSKMAVERISYAFILQMVEHNTGKLVDVRNLVERYRINNIPSTITYYDGTLWVATHSILTNAMMISYTYDKVENKLEAEDSFWIPPKVQGVAFKQNGEVYLSTSYGRTKASHIKKYKSVYTMSNNVWDFIKEIELPPCSEGIVYQNKTLYVLFESAGKKYLEGTDGKGKSKAPIDKILILEEN